MTQPADTADARVLPLGYKPQLDGLRGIAVALVVAYHLVGWPRGGFLGVDVFFALSGFLITSLLVSEWHQSKKLSFRTFYLRRLLRLYPALIVMLGVYVVAFAIFRRYGDVSFDDRLEVGAMAATYVSNWVLNLAAGPPTTEMAHMWSLAIEEQFYLVWPPILLITLRRGSLRRLPELIIALIALLALWRLGLAFFGEADSERLALGTDTRIDEIFIGCAFGAAFMAGRLSEGRRRKRLRRALPLALIGLSAFVLLGAPADPRGFYAGGGLTASALAAGIIVTSAVVDDEGWVARRLRARPLMFLGAISYSLYLWHYPVIVFVQKEVGLWPPRPIHLLSLATSVAIAVASHYLIEKPFLRLKDRVARHQSAPITNVQPS